MSTKKEFYVMSPSNNNRINEMNCNNESKYNYEPKLDPIGKHESLREDMIIHFGI